jgi:filamentous hemagglutinin
MNGDTKAGWKHVVLKHFSDSVNASQFTITQQELRTLLQTPDIVKSPIIRTLQSGRQGIVFQRTIQMNKIVGVDKFSGYKPTEYLTILTDAKGNLITTFPGRLR